ncbi:MAG: TIGR04086 family membrane protein [Lachnospiraceae bacterium]|nr:TIGR04086 family membrane protein [Lachnospiraceae bacterium]
MERARDAKLQPQSKAVVLIKCLLAAYLLTGGTLLLLALLLYRLQLSESIVNIGILVIYILASFLSGLLSGKCMQEKRFLWGLLAGTLYFCILAVLTLIVNHSFTDLGNQFFTTLMICAGSGMLGGMVS